MIQELQLRVSPRTASSMGDIAQHLTRHHDIPAQSIQGIRILKRSIDARQRQVVVNLKVRVYIDEPMTQDYLIPPIWWFVRGITPYRAGYQTHCARAWQGRNETPHRRFAHSTRGHRRP